MAGGLREIQNPDKHMHFLHRIRTHCIATPKIYVPPKDQHESKCGQINTRQS